MAITFVSNYPSSPTITIGGDDTGPFPSYSISRQDNHSGDDTYLNTDYSITVNGVVVVDGDPTIGGQLNDATHREAITKLKLNDIYPTLGFGVLTIQGYDGTSIVFNDARISSVQTPVGDSGGWKYQEYVITFEATDIDGISDIPSVQEVEENWEFQVNDNQFAVDNHDPLGEIYKTFTLTHTLSATGRQSAGGAVEAWRQAVLWIESRIVGKPDNTAVTTHINTKTDGPKFVPYYMNTEADKDQIKTNADAVAVDWESYNGQREITTDISSGSYSVTDTWLIAIKGTPATHTVEFSNAGSQDDGINVTVNGVITGLSTVTPGDSDFNKPGNFSGAEAGWEQVQGRILALAKYAYSKIPGLLLAENNGSLRPNPISRSMSENRTEGTITWSAVFTDKFVDGDVEKIAEQDISVQYKNYKADEKVIAIIPVIGREEGPIIQDFETKNHRVATVTVTMTMTQKYKNEGEAKRLAEEAADKYEPEEDNYINQFDYDYVDAYGIITLNKEWFYK
jgi:hypothetical protein